MSAPALDAATGPQRLPPSYLDEDPGLLGWLGTVDHKRIGVMYLFSVLGFLAVGGTYAMLIRLELLHPNGTFADSLAYNRYFTAHGIVMVWLFMIPSIPSAFGNFMLPIMLGARDVAFPRLNLASYYIFMSGAGLVLWALFDGGLDTGWTFYTPYSLETPTNLIPALGGVALLGFSTIITGMNFIVTTHTMRARGLGWLKLPLFVWAMYGVSIIMVLATPVLGMSLSVVMLDRYFKLGFFDPAMGGDPVLFQHLFWFYSHPAVYIMILPAMGVVSEVVPTFCHKNPFSYKAIAYSTLGIAFVGFLTWGHHMFVAGISKFDAGIFGVLSMMVAIFSAIKTFTWVNTMRGGSIWLRAPLLYFLAFLFLFVFGGMTGVAVAATSLDIHWHDTYFVVAHFHFVMVGGTLTGFLAALHYWFPKMTGRMYNERAATVASLGVFLGFFFTFFPQFLLGNGGMPRRYHTYPEQFQLLNVASTAGASILGGSLVMTAIYLSIALFKGKPAGNNPWRSRSFEWLTASPPPKHNFEGPTPHLVDPYDYSSGIPEA